MGEATHAILPANQGMTPATQANARARPNTVIRYELFTPHTHTMPRVPLKADVWYREGRDYPEKDVIDAIVGIARFVARIGFIGIREGQRIAENLPTAAELPVVLKEDI